MKLTRPHLRATRIVALLILQAVALPQRVMASPGSNIDVRIHRLLSKTPLIDGHNDWAETLRTQAGDRRWTLDLRGGDTAAKSPFNTDIVRLRKGQVGGQFWSVYVSADLPPLEQVKETLEQIDLVKTIVARYPDTFALARTAQDVRTAFAHGRIASMIGVEGGNQIDDSLSVLRAYHDLGAGYLTLTHARTIDWADSATDEPRHHGLTPFGKRVVGELNRLGMLVDLSHVSADVMRDAIATSRAPVIFSHSGARALVDHPRNVPDDVLRSLKGNGGIVMVTFAPAYVSDAYRRWDAELQAEKARLDSPPFGGLTIGQPDRTAAALGAWHRNHPMPHATIAEVADHIEHVARIAGHEHVGIGSDFDGVSDPLPVGLEDVGDYPALFAELARRGWSDSDLAALAGNNILRVMTEAQNIARKLGPTIPDTTRDMEPGNASIRS